VPDATTLLNFRHLLETHDLCKALFTAINADLAARGLLLREGTLVDATLIAAPSSPRMRSARATRKCTRPRRATNGISA
jgi:IS5 family transposase